MSELIKKEILEQKIKELRPWAHQIIFPYGLVADTPPYNILSANPISTAFSPLII